jgi:DNA polymerase III epsilon subunit-like protein
LRELAGEIAPVTARPAQPPHVRTRRPIELGITPFAVLDVETTGFDPLARDRVVEIAIARLSPDGDPIDTWTTLVDPGRPPGPTHVHGITANDLRGAPTFAEIADEVASRLNGAVIVAHNAAYDLRFLAAEFERLGRRAPTWPALCTLALSYLTGSASSRRLSDLCEAEGLTHLGQHSALGDVDATSRLFLVYLRRAKAAGVSRFDQLGVTALELPPAVPSPSRPPQVCPRAIGAVVPTSKTPAPATGDPRIDVYLNAVEEAMADAALAEEETGSLDRLAQELGVDQETATMLHRRFAAAGPISG